jgi:uncharacterized oxidoreductase
MKISNNIILITGGATGIGSGLTERFIQESNTVIICGRRAAALKDVADRFPNVITYVCDLSVEAERIGLYEWIKENHSDLNVLINNAGIQNWMNVSDADFYQKASDEITTNVLAPIHLTSLFIQLPALRTVVNVTSGLAFTPLSKVAVYSATKAFMRSFTISLRYLLKEKNIEVIEMVPPALNTDLGGKGIHDSYPAVEEFVASIFEQLQEGKNELTFGFSEERVKTNNAAIAEQVSQLNK